ncbi:MAG: hypothetical protein ABSB59_31645 [Streptosporangiaceae bacterium]|jgi:hypothetical protein
MVGLELVAGYLVAWAVRKAKRAGARLDKETDEVMDAGLDRLHEVIAAKLGTDPAIEKLEIEAIESQQPSDRTIRRVNDAIEEAAEGDSQFAALLKAVLAELDQVRNGASSVAGIDLRNAQGVQVGNYNTQTNTFN